MLCNDILYYVIQCYIILCNVMTKLIPIISYEYNNPAMPPFTLRKL